MILTQREIRSEVILDRILIPYRIPTHIKNNSLVNRLIKNNIFDDLATKRVDCFVTVGNFSFSKSIVGKVDDLNYLHSYSILIWLIETTTTNNI